MTDELKECRESFEGEYMAVNAGAMFTRREDMPEIYLWESVQTAWEWYLAGKQSRTKPEGVDIAEGGREMAKEAYNAALFNGIHKKPDNFIMVGDDYLDCDVLAKTCARVWHLTAKEE